MLGHRRSRAAGFVVATLAGILMSAGAAMAADPDAIDRDVAAALKALYASTPVARDLATRAKGILVFPNIVKAGFVFGSQYGEGALLKGDTTAGYYNIAAASYGLQAGVQSFGYAMFFMSDSALEYLDKSAGFELGMGPSIVVVDAGKAKSMTSSTMKDDVYAFTFRQKGLMAGLGLQGSKITKVNK